jgi:hypothetical protein
MLELGPTEGTIVSHRSKMLGDKPGIAILCDVGGESAEAVIFLSDKAMGIARRALKQCGFDVDAQPLSMLDSNPTLLAGKKVALLVDEWNGKTQVKIDVDSRASTKMLDAMTAKIRAVKKGNHRAERPARRLARLRAGER